MCGAKSFYLYLTCERSCCTYYLSYILNKNKNLFQVQLVLEAAAPQNFFISKLFDVEKKKKKN